jgi:hypothetical protein
LVPISPSKHPTSFPFFFFFSTPAQYIIFGQTQKQSSKYKGIPPKDIFAVPLFPALRYSLVDAFQLRFYFGRQLTYSPDFELLLFSDWVEIAKGGNADTWTINFHSCHVGMSFQIRFDRKFVGANVCKVNLKISPDPLEEREKMFVVNDKFSVNLGISCASRQHTEFVQTNY